MAYAQCLDAVLVIAFRAPSAHAGSIRKSVPFHTDDTMLSTLSNLLPALSSQDKQDTKPDAPAEEPQSARPSEAAQEDGGERRARDRPRVQNETFIIVRPPPAINNHPLNLQLQLIPPAVHAHGKDRSTASTSSRRSVDFTGTTPEQLPDAEPDNALRRSPSVTSSRSDATSLYSSPSSVGSVSSFGSSASSRRIIVPLYNLSAHNVMTNAVLDAGTDARIAKFLKRGVELIDLCVLEPTEIWQSRNPAPAVDNASLQLPSPAHGDRIGSPAPSMTSAEGQSLEATPQPAAAAAAVKRSRFSSLFNRKDANTRAASLAAPASPTDSPAAKKRASTSPAPQVEHLSTPVLGLQASVYSAVHPPTGKSPASIVWVVRKWIKGSDSSLLGNLRASTRKGHDAAAAAVPTVRFEWVRSAARSGTGDTHSRYATDVTAADSRRSSRIANSAASITSPAADAARPSQPGSPKSVDFAPLPQPEHPAADVVVHDEAASATTATTDAGDESDPEDSETPWTCTLVISLPGNVSPSPSDSSNNHPSKRLSLASTENTHPPAHPLPLHPGAGGSFRLRLATLSPTPHHPKVVAQLKIPWPLPDVDVVQGVAHKRTPGGRPSPPAGAGLLVTAEEMKDVVCTTAFWMIVREGFGGVGRKTRKGDGWRIRG